MKEIVQNFSDVYHFLVDMGFVMNEPIDLTDEPEAKTEDAEFEVVQPKQITQSFK